MVFTVTSSMASPSLGIPLVKPAAPGSSTPRVAPGGLAEHKLGSVMGRATHSAKRHQARQGGDTAPRLLSARAIQQLASERS